MFHLWVKPRPPAWTGRLTPSHAVDSSAMVSTPGWTRWTVVFISWRNDTASRFSLPPWTLGVHWPLLAGVVAVEHRRDRVDAQAVEVQLVEPVEGVGDEEVAHLVRPWSNTSVPQSGCSAVLRVGVLVERRAVEAGEGAVVAGEVGGHPVDEHADAALVEVVDEPAEVVGVAEARGGREEAGDLVAPRRLVGVLGHRHQLDVGEAEVGDVVGERGASSR